MRRSVAVRSTSSTDPNVRLKRRPPAEITFAAGSPPEESLSSDEDDGDDASSMGSPTCEAVF